MEDKININIHPKENETGGIDISNNNKEFIKIYTGFLKRFAKNVY